MAVQEEFCGSESKSYAGAFDWKSSEPGSLHMDVFYHEASGEGIGRVYIAKNIDRVPLQLQRLLPSVVVSR